MGERSGAVPCGAAGHAEPLAEWSDAALVAGARVGDGECFEALHARYRHRVMAFALSRLRHPEDAEDVVQEVFLEIHRCLDRYEGRSSLLVWILGIAQNRLRRRFRRRVLPSSSLDTGPGWDRPKGPGEQRDPPCAAAPVDERVNALRMLQDCARVIDEELQPPSRDIFRLRYVESRSTRQIARALDKSPDAVKASLSRTRRALWERLPDLERTLRS